MSSSGVPSKARGRARAVAAVLVLVLGVLVGPAATAAADDGFSTVRDYVSTRGDYGFHLLREDATGVLRVRAFNNTTSAHSFGLGVDNAVEGQVEPLWDDGLAGVSSAFQTTVQPGTGPEGGDVPTWGGMTYGFYVDLPVTAADPPAERVGTHLEPGRWLPLRFQKDSAGEVQDMHSGYPLALSLSTVSAGSSLRLDVANTGALASGEVWAVPRSAVQSLADYPTFVFDSRYAGLHRFDPAAGRRLATAAIVGGSIHQLVTVPGDLAPGDYAIVVGDPAATWWPVGVTSLKDDHNLTVTPPTSTGAGPNVQLTDPDGRPVTVTFGSQVSGTITLSASTTSPTSEQTGFSFLSAAEPLFYDLTTTAQFDTATVCFPGGPGDHLWHYTGGQWVDITSSLQPTSGVVCGVTDSFSPFVVAAPFTFLAPVANTVLNVAQGGSAIPLKFAGRDKGLRILAAGSPSSRAVACPGLSTDPVEAVALPAGGSALSYDAKTGTYTYVWKTDKAWRNSCRELTLRLADGSAQRATFQFK